MERICSCRSKFFSLRVDTLKLANMQNEVTKVGPIKKKKKKNSSKERDVPVHLGDDAIMVIVKLTE